MRKTKTLGIILIMTLLLCACGSSPKHTVEVTGQEMMTLHDFNVVCVYTDYTNSSGESAIQADWVKVVAYQNGTALTTLTFTGEETNGYKPCDTSVQDGTTAKIVWIFEVDDPEAEVTVEVKDL